MSLSDDKQTDETMNKKFMVSLIAKIFSVSGSLV